MRHEPGEMVQLKLMHDAKTLTSSETVFYTESKTNNVPFVLLEVLDVNRTLMDVCSSQNVVLLMTNMTSTNGVWSPTSMALNVVNKAKSSVGGECLLFGAMTCECFKSATRSEDDEQHLRGVVVSLSKHSTGSVHCE